MKKLALVITLSLIAAPALAHTGVGHVTGFVHGLEHPIFGPDHLLAMLAVGLWSGFALPGRVWAGAASFLGAMSLGAAASWAGIGFPGVESAITASVLVFGMLVLLARVGQPKALTLATLLTIAGFASAHGHAHATEATGGAIGYLAGFLLATTALHLAGILLARACAGGLVGRLVQGALGVGIAASGLMLIAG